MDNPKHYVIDLRNSSGVHMVVKMCVCTIKKYLLCVCAIDDCFPNGIVIYFRNMNQVNHAT